MLAKKLAILIYNSFELDISHLFHIVSITYGLKSLLIYTIYGATAYYYYSSPREFVSTIRRFASTLSTLEAFSNFFFFRLLSANGYFFKIKFFAFLCEPP